jgi:glutamine amidotransferase
MIRKDIATMAQPKVVIVDYHCGNLFSIQRALREIGFPSFISSVPKDVEAADKIILPGVGAFGDGMRNLCSRGLTEVILKSAASGKYILGICLGMQLLFDESFEFGYHQGLKLISGSVKRLQGNHPQQCQPVKIPHIGWNAVNFILPTERRVCKGVDEWHLGRDVAAWTSRSDENGGDMGVNPWDSTNDLLAKGIFLEGLVDGTYMYFLHSFGVQTTEKRHCLAQTEYGINSFCAIAQKDNILGVQFHPELSGESGLRLLRNFVLTL